MSEEVGRVIGEPSTTAAPFVSTNPPRVGEYVILEYEDFRVLGMVEYVLRVNEALQDVYDERIIDRIRSLDGGKSEYVKGIVRLLGDVKRPREGYPLPRIPPPPGTRILRADTEVLQRIFGRSGRRKLKLGTLLSRHEVEVYVDVNKMVTRHLAILAITGAGKSNTVAVIADQLAGLGATMLIFDMHADYVDSDIGNLHRVEPKLNPFYMTRDELLRLLRIDSSAHRQARVFRAVYKGVRKAIENENTGLSSEELLGAMKYVLYRLLELDPPDDIVDIGSKLEGLHSYEKLLNVYKQRSFRDSTFGVLSKLEDFEERLAGVIDSTAEDALERLRKGMVNVVDLSLLDEEDADVVVSHYLRRILYERKRARVGDSDVDSMKAPVFVVLEEAHILAPRDRHTMSKYWIGRIAREGRKFGVGLCLVSQRPKGLDVDALSQVNNMVILKLVEPGDQRHVQQASEQLSEDLLHQLPALNVGEAVVIGPMVTFPVMLKIDKFQGRLGGSDIDVLGEWEKSRGAAGERAGRHEDLIDMDY